MLDLSLLSRKELRKLLYAFLLTLISLLVGTLGFMEIEKFRLSEAFYMSVITVSTVGFNEVEPLSDAGRIFTSFYILFNLGIFAYVISVITAYIFEGEFGKIYKRFKVDREVNKMREHVIVCGFGRNGMKACEELHRSKRQFVIIDRDAQLIEQQSAHYPFHFMLGEATADETLKSAGIERASNLIITLPNDAENVFITLTAKELNKNVKVISRASDPNSLKNSTEPAPTRLSCPTRLVANIWLK
ncbi:MAG: hypothetical protein HC842_07030 [Cytophagales bacterium]|nr:hypothetical protein [Cytophagales bacterium]